MKNEILERNHRAINYSTRVYIRRLREAKKNRIVWTLFAFAVMFFLFALAL